MLVPKLIRHTLCAYALCLASTTLLGTDKVEKTAKPTPEQVKQMIMDKIGAKLNKDGMIELGGITIDPSRKELIFDATLSNWNTEELEVLISTPEGRAHEALLTTKVDPYKLQLALILLGAQNGGRMATGELQQGSLINIDIQPLHEKEKSRIPVESWLFNYKTNKRMKRSGWVFVGSSFDGGQCIASQEGNLVNIWSLGNTILDNPESTGDMDDFICVYGSKIPTNDFDIETVPHELWKLPIKVFMTIK